MPITISEKKIKSKIKLGETVAVVENIKYPHFENEEHKKLCSRMNSFYLSVAEKYSYFAHNKLVKKISLHKSRYKLPLTLSMNYTAAFCGESIVSVVLDLTFTEGKNIKTRRFSQMWSVEKKDMLSASEILRTDRKSIRKIHSIVFSIADKNAENSAFGYFEDYSKKLSKNFDVNCCFAVPNGLCFFVNAGILSPIKYGANSFVLPFDVISDVAKGEFLPKNGQKEPQNTDIVNNV